MRMMARICIPVENGNKSIQDGSLPRVIQQTAERWNPEAMYFTTFDGRRTAYLVLDLPDSSAMVEFSEPFFAGLDAEVEVVPVMNGEDLQKGLAALG